MFLDKQRNSDHDKPQKRFHENTDRKDVFDGNRNSNDKDDMKRLLYPSKEDALRKNIDVSGISISSFSTYKN